VAQKLLHKRARTLVNNDESFLKRFLNKRDFLEIQMKQLKTKLLVAAVLSAVNVGAFADVSFNVGVTSDYRFRGISQSGKGAAVSGGVDFSDKSGLYLGTWASTIDFDAGPGADPDANAELDLYGGYKFKAGAIDWDVGAIYYGYPGSDGDFELPFTEVYLGGTYGPISVKYSYTNDFTGLTDGAASYLGVSGTFDLGGGYSLGMSLGESFGDGIKETLNNGDDSYIDYKIGVSKEFGGFGFNLSYVGTNIDPEWTTDVFNSEDVFVLTVSKTF
jgi:uncharacterized protein (TIGR02001 family)